MYNYGKLGEEWSFCPNTCLSISKWFYMSLGIRKSREGKTRNFPKMYVY